MTINKIEIQDAEGNIYHPHTTSDIVFHNGKTVFEELNDSVKKSTIINGSYLDSNGYTKLPNGMIMQWGLHNHSYSAGHIGFTGFQITYPISFINKCVSLQLTPMLNQHDIDKVTHMHIEDTNTGELRLDHANVKYHLNSGGAFTTKVYWVAMGF